MKHGPWLMEQAERISLKFEAGIRFQKCDVTGCYWAGSGQGVGQMEMTRTCGQLNSPWKIVDFPASNKTVCADQKTTFFQSPETGDWPVFNQFHL